MPELTDEHVEDLFAELRSDHLHQVRPPGAAVVHATVRRRRITASVTAGLVLAVTGVTAAGAAGLAPARDRDHRPGQAILDGQTLLLLTEAAGAAVQDHALHSVNQALTGKAALKDSYRRVDGVLAGTYSMAMTCVGDGSTNVAINVGPHGDESSKARETKRITLSCERQAVVESVTIVIPKGSHLRVEASPDRAAVGRSAFAYRAELEPADQQRLTRHADTALAKGTYEADAESRSVFMKTGIADDRLLGTGSYRLEVTCTGAGNIGGELHADPIRLSGQAVAFEVVCADQPPALTVSFTKDADKAMRVTLQPDAVALGQSAVAYRMVPD